MVVQEPTARIKQLIAGTAIKTDPNVPLRRYFRSGKELIRMAVVYHEEKNLESAYTLYMRYMVLFLEEIAKHPEYPTYPAEEKSKNKKKCMSLLSLAENIKSQLLKKYEKEFEVFVEEQKKIEADLDRRRQKEEEERRLLREEQDKIRQQKEIEDAHQYELDALKSFGQHAPSAPPSYETLSPRKESLYPESEGVEGVKLPPSAPYGYEDPPPYESRVPELPSRALKPSFDQTSPSSSGACAVPPTFDRSVKPSMLGGGGALRTVKIPKDLVTKFLALANKNTLKNVETCGVLAGKLKGGELTITHLLIPQQSGTSDSCTTQQEEQLFDVQDKYEIITLGWIHTHPSQTAFLSSVDLHTHCSYQLMMPEAIAIVCAPKHNHNAVFTLTSDFGLDYIANCRETGFHPHPTHPQLFKEAEHAVVEDCGSVTVVDLR